MQVIQGTNVNQVWIDGLWRLKINGVEESSRNGRVIVVPEPVTSVYTRPWERVLFNSKRDANPFFHLMESLWMLAGSCDLEFVEKFNSRMEEFSDDKSTLNGAYGYRWRVHFERDQILDIIRMLRQDNTTRRAVLGMWDPMEDLGSKSKDIPCNTHCYFRVKGETLDMTVCCRSNDAVWGAYGANAVHFSILHEFIARAVGMKQGTMYQISNNFHIYERHWDFLRAPAVMEDMYEHTRGRLCVPLFDISPEYRSFLNDCDRIVIGEHDRVVTPFFINVVLPAFYSWIAYKEERYDDARDVLDEMPVCDWQLAMAAWLQRRVK